MSSGCNRLSAESRWLSLDCLFSITRRQSCWCLCFYLIFLVEQRSQGEILCLEKEGYGVSMGAAHSGNASATNPKEINKQDWLIRENTAVVATVINHCGLYFPRATLERNSSVIIYTFSVRYEHRHSPELTFSVLSHPAAQRPQWAHPKSHRCLHLHPSKSPLTPAHILG